MYNVNMVSMKKRRYYGNKRIEVPTLGGAAKTNAHCTAISCSVYSGSCICHCS